MYCNLVLDRIDFLKKVNQHCIVDYIVSAKSFRVMFGNYYYKVCFQFHKGNIDRYPITNLNIPKLLLFDKENNLSYFSWIEGIDFFQLQRFLHLEINEEYAFKIGNFIKRLIEDNVIITDAKLHNFIYMYNGNIAYIDVESIGYADKVDVDLKLEGIKKHFLSYFRNKENIQKEFLNGLYK